MKRLLCATALVLPVLSACGEKAETPRVEVKGEAKIELAPDLFSVDARILERGKDRVQSLDAAARKLNELRDRLKRLEGLESFEIEAQNTVTQTIRPTGCDPAKDEYGEAKDYPESCQALDHLASIEVSIEGEPAAAAGPVVSLLVELPVEDTDSLKFRVKDPEAARDAAREAALAKAMQIARTLARRAGAEVGTPLSIKYSDGGDTIIVTGSRIPVEVDLPSFAPMVTLVLPEEKVTFETEVTVQFALEKPKSEK